MLPTERDHRLGGPCDQPTNLRLYHQVSEVSRSHNVNFSTLASGVRPTVITHGNRLLFGRCPWNPTLCKISCAIHQKSSSEFAPGIPAWWLEPSQLLKANGCRDICPFAFDDLSEANRGQRQSSRRWPVHIGKMLPMPTSRVSRRTSRSTIKGCSPVISISSKYLPTANTLVPPSGVV